MCFPGTFLANEAHEKATIFKTHEEALGEVKDLLLSLSLNAPAEWDTTLALYTKVKAKSFNKLINDS